MSAHVRHLPPPDPLQAVLAGLAMLDPDQLQQVQAHVAALLAAYAPRPPLPPATRPTRPGPDLPASIPRGPRGGGYIEWKWKRGPHGAKQYGPYPYLRLRVAGRQRSIYLKELAQAARTSQSIPAPT